MPRISKLRQRLNTIRHPKLVELVKIGPIWPDPLELVDIPRGMRNVPRKKTKSPFDIKYREHRRIKNRVASKSRWGNKR